MSNKLLKLIGLSILLGIIGWAIFVMVNQKMPEGPSPEAARASLSSNK